MRKKRMDKTLPLKNPVAKFAYQFNKAKVFKDKTKYQRKAKHKESFPIIVFTVIGKGSFLWARIFYSLSLKNYKIA